MNSIYSQILAAVGSDGRLPDGFALQAEDCTPGIQLTEGPMAGQTIRFASGAEDGIWLFHGGWGPDEEQLERLKEITRMAGSPGQEDDQALAGLDDCFRGWDRMLSCAKHLQRWIAAQRSGLDGGKLFRFACTLLTGSSSVGGVKYALTLLDLLQSEGGEWQDHVRTLALWDELTLFCIFVMSGWESANEDIFAAAQKVRGWGRVHAVRALEPETREMQDWLLDEGWDNDVLPAYTAKDCARKGELLERLEGKMTRTRLDAAGGLVLALLDEGPCRNISAMDEGLAIMQAYLGQVQRAKPDFSDQDRETVQAILEAAGEDQFDVPQLHTQAEQVLAMMN